MVDHRRVIRAGKIVKEILDFGLKSIPIYTGGGAAKGIKSLHTLLHGKDTKTRYRYRMQITKLGEAGLILLGGEHIRITDAGKQFLKEHQHHFVPLKHTRWNGIWHIVSYDIPNEKNRGRNYFRYNLKQWGFYQIHKSTWVIPYECKQEVAILAQELSIAPYVLYLNAIDLPMEERLKKQFGLEIG